MRTKLKNQLIFFFPVFNIGGVEKNFFSISSYLSNELKNTKISLITYSQNNFTRNKINSKINIHTFFLKLIPLPRRFKFIICSLILFFKLLFKSNTLIFSFQGNFYSLLIAAILRKKIIIRSNLSPEYWSKSKFKKKIFKYLLSKSDFIIVNSNKFKDNFEKEFNLKCSRIYNPISFSEIKKNINLNFKYKFFKKKTLNLINIGRLVKVKNQIEILIALKKQEKTNNFRLLIIGDGPEKKNIKNYIKNNKLNRIVKILSTQKNKFNYLNCADIFVCSSTNEGMPNVLLEAAVLKKFIISSDCPTGPKEIINNYKYGKLYKTFDKKKLTNILRYIENNRIILKSKKKKINYNGKIFDEKYNLSKYKIITKSLLN